MSPLSRSQLVVRALGLASGLALGVWPQSAAAFSSAIKFPAPVSEGGGAGRYFTASYQDGYACSVCHSGGVEPKIHVSGLPVDGFQPGVTYPIEVTWENPAVQHGLNLELIGKDGSVPGQVALLDPALVDARGRCTGMPKGDVPAFEHIVGKRKILGIAPCSNVQSLRFNFTPSNVPELAFSLSAVRSDTHADVEGDGVTTLRKVLRRVGEPARTGDCSLRTGAPAAPGYTLLALVCTALLGRRRRAG